jgi:predicted membrane-bound spermidine synthase
MITLIVTFISSFATMAYSMIVSSMISDFTGEEIYSQCFSIGPYLLGMGLGSYFFERQTLTETTRKLWDLEYLSIMILPLYPIMFQIFIFLLIGFLPMEMGLDNKKTISLILGFGSILSFIAGILGGGQLPLILKSHINKFKIETILATNYLGPLIAGPFIIIFSQFEINYSNVAGFIGLIQFLGLFFLLFKLDHSRKIRLTLLLAPLLLLTTISQNYPEVERITSKASYFYPKLELKDLFKLNETVFLLDYIGNISRTRSPYQIIEVVTLRQDKKNSEEDISTLYLNRKTQFGKNSSAVYHETMLYGTLNLNRGKINNILILGGGDGILLDMIQKEFPEENITFVELDEKMIHFSNSNDFLLRLNNGVFEKHRKKTNIVIGDAITYLRKIQNQIKFDLIFIDFPFPNGHELSKLYSFEFYSLVKNVTKKESLVTIDLPLFFNDDSKLLKESANILATISKVGFTNQLGYGTHSPFVTVTREKMKLNFNYDLLPKNISLATKINLHPVTDSETLKRLDLTKRVNSMFWPKR